jgi:putative FmdB family regulatory protein
MITELMQKMTDAPPRACPECGSRKIAKLVSRSAFQLKGGGWYKDLYASPKADAPGSKKAPKGAEPAAAAPAAEKASTPAASPAGAKKAGGDSA